MRIFSLVLNSVEFDSRVRKTAKTLSAFGNVTVWGLRDSPDQSPIISGADYLIERPITYAKGARHGLSKRLAQASAYLRYLVKVGFTARKGNVVICNDLATLPVGLVAKFFHPSLKLVYDSHEYQAHTRWVSPLKRWFIQKIERFALRFTAANVVVSPSIAKAYSQDYRIALPHVVMNCPQQENCHSTGRLRTKIGAHPRDCILLYQGGLSEGRGIEQILAAFRELPNPKMHLVFMGYGPFESLIRTAAEYDDRIKLVNAVPPDEVLSYTADADFGFCYLSDPCLNYQYSLPNKVFEYLMSGVPIVANNLIEVRQIIERYAAGLVVNDISVPALVAALKALPEFKRTHFLTCLPELRATYNWEQQAKVWEEIMSDLGAKRCK